MSFAPAVPRKPTKLKRVSVLMIRGLAAVLQLVSVRPGSQEIRPVCGGRFLTPSCLQSGLQRDVQTPVAAGRRRTDDFCINSNSDFVVLITYTLRITEIIFH